jgi:energy-coupling factor transporter transmembrane protein EcfT
MTSQQQPPAPPTGKQPVAFAYQAAKASWIGPIIIFLLFAFAHQVAAGVLLELIALVLIVAGICLGVAGLFGIRKHGKKGILAPALVGLVLNGLLLFIFITNFVAARAAAHTH